MPDAKNDVQATAERLIAPRYLMGQMSEIFPILRTDGMALFCNLWNNPRIDNQLMHKLKVTG